MKNKKTQKPKKFRVSKNGSSFFRNTHRVVIDGISISTQKLFDTRKKNGVMLAVDFTEKVLPLLPERLQSRKNQLLYSDLTDCLWEGTLLQSRTKKRLPLLKKLVPVICSMAIKQSDGKEGALATNKYSSNVFHCLDGSGNILSLFVFYHSGNWLFRAFRFGEIGCLSKGSRVFRSVIGSKTKKLSFL